jgi:hypothetical protein
MHPGYQAPLGASPQPGFGSGVQNCVMVAEPLTAARQELADRLAELQARRAAFEKTAERARSPWFTARRSAVAQLADFPIDWTHPVLCEALRDPDLQVREAAAGVLGRHGDERAIGPLLEALRSGFVGRSARWNLLAGWGLALATAVMFAGLGAGVLFLKVGGMMWLALNIGTSIYKAIRTRRQERGRANPALIDALLTIGERSPTPELRAALPDLRAVSADVFQQAQNTRLLSRRAADRLEALTERLKDLPLTAQAPAASPDSLPRSAETPLPDPVALPRAVEPLAEESVAVRR